MTCGSCTFGKYMCLLPKCLEHRCHLGSQTVSISPLSEMPLESCRKQRIMMPTCQCFAGQVVGDGKEKIVVQNCWRCIVCLAFSHVFLSLFSLCWRVALLPTRTCWLGDASTLFWQRCYCRQIFMLFFLIFNAIPLSPNEVWKIGSHADLTREEAHCIVG